MCEDKDLLNKFKLMYVGVVGVIFASDLPVYPNSREGVGLVLLSHKS